MRIGHERVCFASGVASTANRTNYAVVVLRDVKDKIMVLVSQKEIYSMGIQNIDSYAKQRRIFPGGMFVGSGLPLRVYCRGLGGGG